jgi:hypothetical protein
MYIYTLINEVNNNLNDLDCIELFISGNVKSNPSNLYLFKNSSVLLMNKALDSKSFNRFINPFGLIFHSFYSLKNR